MADMTAEKFKTLLMTDPSYRDLFLKELAYNIMKEIVNKGKMEDLIKLLAK